MEAVKRPNAEGHDGDPNDVLRDHGIEDLKERLDEAFDPGVGETCDPGNGESDAADDPGPDNSEYDEAGQRFDETPPNDGEEDENLNGHGANGKDASGDNGFDEFRKRFEEEQKQGARKGQQAAPNKFKPTRYRDNRPMLREEWITKGLLPGPSLIGVYGPPGCGKSFFALHWALHAAAGIAYAGRKTRKVRVVYIAAEGQAGFRKRVKAAGAALELPNDTQFDLIEAVPDLGLGNDDLKLLIEAIESGAEEGDEPVKIIVIDTLSRSLGGADENGPGMAKFVENCGKLSMRFNCAVVFVHHTGKDVTRGMRGWSGLHAATDGEFEVSKKNGVHYVRMAKMKDAEDTLGWSFALKQVVVGEDEDGDAVTSCVVELLSEPARVDDHPAGSADGKPKRSVPRSLRDFDDALNEALTVHGKPILLTGAGAISTTVKAVDLKKVREEFSKRRAVAPDDDDSDPKESRRKRDKAISAAFQLIMKNLPSQYPTEWQGDTQYIWRLECKS